MSSCKDCIHYELCDGYKIFDVEINNEDCKDFKDTRSVIELPIPAEDWLRAELSKYCEKRCVDEL